MTSLALFDLDEMLAEVAEAAVTAGRRVPDGFSLDYFKPDELIDAFEVWVKANDVMGSYAVSRMWHLDNLDSPGATGNGHSLVSFTADLRRCEHPIRSGCSCVGELVQRVICEPCSWQAFGYDSDVIHAWHDHAWAGWRELPRLPDELRPIGGGVGAMAMDKAKAKKASAWLEDAHPTEFKVQGAPMLTNRDGIGTRCVSGYSPWNGFDISANRLDEQIGRAAA